MSRVRKPLLRRVREKLLEEMGWWTPPTKGEMLAAKCGGIEELRTHLAMVENYLPHHIVDFCELAPDGEELLGAYRRFCSNGSSDTHFVAFAMALLKEHGVHVPYTPLV